MGAGMARSLRREGHEVVAWNRSPDKAAPLRDDGIEVAESVADAVGGADAAVTILFDTGATLSVADELLGSLGPDAVWIQSGTVGIDGIRRIAEHADRDILDAPVVGTKKPAEEGKLTVLLSGNPELAQRAQPVFDAIGGRTVTVSDRVGDASALKLVVNSWIGTITAGTAQSVTFAASLGVDPRLFLEVIEGSPTDSPYAQLKGRAILDEDYAPSFAIDGVVKDIGLMLEAAGDVDFSDDLMATVRALFQRASERGHGDKDMAAVRYAFRAE
jgi:3-hydroxyisobutyrate dehydrogenase